MPPLRLPTLPTRLPSPTRLLPCACALCGDTADSALCQACRARYVQTPAARCQQCAARMGNTGHAGDRRCGACLSRPMAFDATVVAADYAPPLDQLALALKFGHRLAIAPLMADLMHATIEQALPADALPDVLAPVPLGAQRLQERGFNQALEIARPLSRKLGIALAPRLAQRLRDTPPQARLHGEQRHANLRGAFTMSAAQLASVRGAHVGIVDDVITTGETLHELAATLKRFGAARVTNLVFARTLPRA